MKRLVAECQGIYTIFIFAILPPPQCLKLSSTMSPLLYIPSRIGFADVFALFLEIRFRRTEVAEHYGRSGPK